MRTLPKLLLVINAGSSSLKYKLFDASRLGVISSGKIDCISPHAASCTLEIHTPTDVRRHNIRVGHHTEAMAQLITHLEREGVIHDRSQVKAVGHRVVHGGEIYSKPTRVTMQMLSELEKLSNLAPLHNPPSIAAIKVCRRLFPHASQIALFDTSFHQTIAKERFLYGLPLELYKKYGIRKYGFHGISHQYIAKKTLRLLGKSMRSDVRIISCHLGNGSSITAIQGGKSVDTSMGFTPLDGLIMGTRSGSIDPEIIFYLLQKKHMTPAAVETILQERSGLIGITGTSDLRGLRELRSRGNKNAELGFHMLADRIVKYIGSYIAVMDGVDAISFTGGIGEYGYEVRELVMSHFTYLGIRLSAAKNSMNAEKISTPSSRVPVFVIPADEEREIANELKSIVE